MLVNKAFCVFESHVVCLHVVYPHAHAQALLLTQNMMISSKLLIWDSHQPVPLPNFFLVITYILLRLNKPRTCKKLC